MSGIAALRQHLYKRRVSSAWKFWWCEVRVGASGFLSCPANCAAPPADAKGQPRRLSDLGMSASPPTPDYRCGAAKRRFAPIADIAPR